MKNQINIKNRKAFFDFELLDRYTAGIQLKGTEIKSIRAGKLSFIDSFCFFKKEELWVKGIHISEYSKGSYNNHEPKRERKLLLQKRELKKIQKKISEKGFTIVPVRMFISKTGYAKIEIALAKGKKTYDKRETIKRKDAKRELEKVNTRFKI